MKLSAIVSRGSRRDFIDVACILENYADLPELLRLAPAKFPESPDFAVTALRALVYFDDAEKEDDPVPASLAVGRQAGSLGDRAHG